MKIFVRQIPKLNIVLLLLAVVFLTVLSVLPVKAQTTNPDLPISMEKGSTIAILLVVILNLIQLISSFVKGKESRSAVCPISHNGELSKIDKGLSDLHEVGREEHKELRAGVEELVRKHQSMDQTCAFSRESSEVLSTLRRMEAGIAEMNRNLTNFMKSK